MITFIPKNIIKKSVSVDDKFIIMIDAFDPIFKNDPLERARNVFLIKLSGEVIWRVYSKFDEEADGSYLDIYKKDEKLQALRWDGGEYEIDIVTGFATPGRFLK